MMRKSEELIEVKVKSSDWIKKYLQQESSLDDDIIEEFIVHIMDEDLIPLDKILKHVEGVSKEDIKNLLEQNTNGLSASKEVQVDNDEIFFTCNGIYFTANILSNDSFSLFSDEIQNLRDSIFNCYSKMAKFLKYCKN